MIIGSGNDTTALLFADSYVVVQRRVGGVRGVLDMLCVPKEHALEVADAINARYRTAPAAEAQQAAAERSRQDQVRVNAEVADLFRRGIALLNGEPARFPTRDQIREALDAQDAGQAAEWRRDPLESTPPVRVAGNIRDWRMERCPSLHHGLGADADPDALAQTPEQAERARAWLQLQARSDYRTAQAALREDA